MSFVLLIVEMHQGKLFKLTQLNVFESIYVENRWTFWLSFHLQCVGLRQAALNNLNLLRKNSQLCSRSNLVPHCYRTTAGC